MTGTKELTSLECSKALVKEKPYKISDRGGLHLLVTQSGGKLWRWQYRFEGKQKQICFGKFPDVPLAKVRLLHTQARALLATGVDPMVERVGTKAHHRAELGLKPGELSFGELARQWFDGWKQGKNENYADDVKIRIENDVIGKLGDRTPRRITRMDIVRIVKETDERGANDVARRNLQFIRKIFDWGQNNGLLDQNLLNPAASIQPDMILRKVAEKHFSSLGVNELPELLRKMENYSGGPYTRIAMELISLTVLRTGELIGGRWEEIDREEARWVVPAERMKMKTKHIVPLSTQALAVLERLHGLSGKTGRLFPDYYGGTGVMSNNTILKALGRMGYKGRMTGHGWRSIFSTYLHEHGFDRDHIETQLSHLTGNAVARAYNYALYLEPRAKMMQAWADFLDARRKAKPGTF